LPTTYLLCGAQNLSYHRQIISVRVVIVEEG
jgi:hypothetical protein